MNTIVFKYNVRKFVLICFFMIFSVITAIMSESWINIGIGILISAVIAQSIYSFKKNVSEGKVVFLYAQCKSVEKTELNLLDKQNLRLYYFEIKKIKKDNHLEEIDYPKNFAIIKEKKMFKVSEYYAFVFKKSSNSNQLELEMNNLVGYESFSSMLLLKDKDNDIKEVLEDIQSDCLLDEKEQSQDV